MKNLRIVVADDHMIIRHGVRKILESETGWRVIGEAGDGETAVRLALELKPDVLVIDIGMPLVNGIEATKRIVEEAPEIAVLILSIHSAEAFISRALQAGARGYLLKDAAAEDLRAAVAAVADGKPPFTFRVSDHHRGVQGPSARR